MAVIRILGIDPGTQVVGFGCLELCEEEPGATAGAGPDAAATPMALRATNVVRVTVTGVRPIDCGVLRLGGRQQTVAERLAALGEQFALLVDRLGPAELALEEAFYGKSVQAALRIGEARGVVLATAAQRGLAVHQYPPARIKRCVTGRGDAKKEVVADMVLRQLGAGTGHQLPADASDALAAALTRLEERRAAAWTEAPAAAGDRRPRKRR